MSEDWLAQMVSSHVTGGSYVCYPTDWVAEVSELFVIVAKNSVCSVAKKDEKKISNKWNEKRNDEEEFPKRKKKWKLACNKKGIKFDFKYIHKKLSMNLLLRGENEKYPEVVTATVRGRKAIVCHWSLD